MSVRVLCVGDVVGHSGRKVLKAGLPHLVAEHSIDCVVVNAENVAGGAGITPDLFEKILGYGADVITLGDHIYRRKEIIATLEQTDRAVKPVNLPRTAPGPEFVVRTVADRFNVAVISVLGRLFMKPPVDCPFRALDRVLGQLPQDVHAIVVDMHAEATSEKVAMGWHLDGRVSLVFGTHTHIPTADERVLPGGTGYLTDVGMTGPYDSVLGRKKERVLSALINGVPKSFDVADGDPRLCGVLADVDPNTRRTTRIQRICYSAGGA